MSQGVISEVIAHISYSYLEYGLLRPARKKHFRVLEFRDLDA